MDAQPLELARRAREASRRLAAATAEQKDRWLSLAVAALEERGQEVLQANAQDVARAAEQGLGPAQIDRLTLNPRRLQDLAAGLRAVRGLADPVGQILEERTRPNGLVVRKVAVPLGVLFFIYEARPNVTVDAAALAVKSGNAIILRGGKEALASNRALHALLQEPLPRAGLPADAVQLVTDPDRGVVGELLRLSEYIDLAIPRGGEGLIRTVAERAAMPVLKHYRGNCHVYVDQAADLNMAESILINSKCQRPGVCNAAESLLVHRAIAERFLPRTLGALAARGVEVRGCPQTQELVPGVRPATEEDYAAEYLDLVLSVRVVESLEEAMEHIARFGSKHTETIVTGDAQAAERFTALVDSAAVMVNASTRFHDGFELGLGAEIGISTDKFHARGPCGLKELTSYKYVVLGNGQVRA